MNELEKRITDYFRCQPADLTLASRLLKNNMVYHLKNKNMNCAIKIFRSNDAEDRFHNEIAMYNFFEKTGLINTPEIIDYFNGEFGYTIVISWIEGLSLKTILKEKGYEEAHNMIFAMLNDMNHIWAADTDSINGLKDDKIGISARLKKSETEIMGKICNNKQNIDFELLFNTYTNLLNEANPKFEHLINSDVSAHEYIIADNIGYWIDFEKFKIGDPNNDMARFFQSVSNTFKNYSGIEELYAKISENKYFDKMTFLYYLTEKLMCSIHDAPGQITEQEIQYYTEFITKRMVKKKKQL